MATKRKDGNFEENGSTAKKLKPNSVNGEKLVRFLTWCDSNGLILSTKVSVRKEGSCAQYGMMAVDDITEGEVLFEIPRRIVINHQTCAISNVLSEATSVPSKSGWLPSLLALMHETVKSDSFWKPYLDLVPDYEELDLPMFWSEADRTTLLQGTGVVESVRQDESNIKEEFETSVLPFIQKYPQHFPAPCDQLVFFKRVVAFMMSYSFTEPTSHGDDDSSSDDDSDDEEQSKPKDTSLAGIPMMVPMADILNHVAKNNAHLDFGEKSLKMIATKDISAGEEVYNTYGECSNSSLLHMYGFSEPYPKNHYDTVEMPCVEVKQWLEQYDEAGDAELVKKKIEYLQNEGYLNEDPAFVVGVEGFLTGADIRKTLQVMTMEKEVFCSLAEEEQDGWKEADEDVDEEPLDFVDIAKCCSEWKQLLLHLTQKKMATYGKSLDSIRPLFHDDMEFCNLNKRQQWAVHCVHSQLEILQTLKEQL